LLGISLLVFFRFSDGARRMVRRAPGCVFWTDGLVNLIFITLAGLSSFASAITEEKEEMTLGLLRDDGAQSNRYLLGKSTEPMIGALLLLLVQVPFIMLAVTLGGRWLAADPGRYGRCWPTMFFSLQSRRCCSRSFSAIHDCRGFALIVLCCFFSALWALTLSRARPVLSYQSQSRRWPILPP